MAGDTEREGSGLNARDIRQDICRSVTDRPPNTLIFTSPFGSTADMAGPDAGLVPVENDPSRKWGVHRSIRENVDFCGGDEQSLPLPRPSQSRIATRSHQRRCQAATAFCSNAQVAQAPSPPRNCGLFKFEYVSAKCTELLFKICFRRRTVPIGQCQRDVSPISGL